MATPREGWRGPALVGLSLLGLALCVCVTAAITLADRVPRQIDRYLMTRAGEAGLYRVTYAGGHTGFLTVNVVVPSSDSLSYAAILGQGGRAMQINYRFTNWQGTGEAYTRVDTLARDDNRLLLIAQQLPDSTVFPEPPIEEWSPAVLKSSSESPLETAVTLYGEPWTMRRWRDGSEQWALPDGPTATAERIQTEWWVGGQLVETLTRWHVAGMGEVRLEQRDGQGALVMSVDLLTSTRFDAEAARRLPWDDLLPEPSTTTAFFREGPRRTGAWPDAALAGPDLKITYRRQFGVDVTASPVYADGLFYLADQSGQLAAVEAYGAAPRWQFTAGGPIVAAPAVAGGILYVGAGDKRLYALEARQGHFLWQVRLLDNVSTSPVVADGTVYVGAEDRTLYALDARTGAARWRFVAGDRLVSSPAVAGGLVIFGGDDGLVYALDAATGDLLWRYAMDSAVVATPAISEAGLVYSASDGQQLSAVDAATGDEVWTVKTRFGYLASPVVGHNHVYAAGSGGTVYAYEAATGAPAWEWTDPTEAGFVSSPLLVGPHLIGINSDGQLRVWEAATGDLLHFADTGDAMTASPTWTGEAVLIANGAGDLMALQGGPEARGLSLTHAWQREYNAGEESLEARAFGADPVLVGDTLYALLRGGRLWAIDAASGRAQELADFGEEVLGTPVEREGTLYAATTRGNVIAYDLTGGEPLWGTALDASIRFGPTLDEARVYVHTLGGPDTIVTALDAATGDVVWEHAMPDGNSTPVRDGDLLYVSGTAITALDPATGEVRWESEPLVALGCLAVFDGVVFAGDGDSRGASFLALDASTGETLWRREDNAHFLYGRPAYDPMTGTILAGTQEGGLYAFAAGNGELRWRLQVDSALQSTMPVRDGVVFATASSGQLYAVEIATGRLLNNYRPGTNLLTLAGPVLGEGVVYAVHGHTLHALALNAEGR